MVHCYTDTNVASTAETVNGSR